MTLLYILIAAVGLVFMSRHAVKLSAERREKQLSEERLEHEESSRFINQLRRRDRVQALATEYSKVLLANVTRVQLEDTAWISEAAFQMAEDFITRSEVR